MNTQGAFEVDWSKPAMREFAEKGITQRIGGVSDEFVNFMFFSNVPRGVLSLYAGEFFQVASATLPTEISFCIDWRLHHGVGRCIFETQPAATTTLFTDDKTFPLKREGLLLQLGGLEADSYLLRARLRGVPTGDAKLSADFKLDLTFFPRVTPGLQSSFAAVTVGSVAG